MDKTLSTLEAMVMHLNWGQIFSLPNETHQHMVTALQCPEHYAKRVEDVREMPKVPVQCVSCNAAVIFTVNDLVLGSKPHNYPLFMTSYIKEQRVNRILVDGGLATSIMLKSMMYDLAIIVEELSKSQMMIQRFNLEG